ncbi:hypothetical protein [Imhoffiella purpurea]|uniref:Uncharacterized protein n=1 Tax=Imhoffiella purpurea TaxID=1249627 RepID=W9VDL4_9GAMM|nr:hypothetical protein [Imhoffiella purpurea]EXJ14132.1 hypothetical protein D779_2946 [Imhoffiella purpurea]
MNLEERTQGLLDLVLEYRERECRAILDAARADAAHLLRDTYGRERARLHDVVLSERRDARARIQAIRAERDTRLRARSEGVQTHLLELAWPRLRSALESCWEDPGRRQRWTRSAAAQARAVMPLGTWRVRHPPDWAAGERRAMSEWILGQGLALPQFLADGVLRAGLLIQCGDALLDASLDGLLRDRRRIEARLLALLAAPLGGGDGE